MSFLLKVVPLLLEVDHATSTKAIVESIRQRYGHDITMRQAQKVKTALCSSLPEVPTIESTDDGMDGAQQQDLDVEPEVARPAERIHMEIDPHIASTHGPQDEGN